MVQMFVSEQTENRIIGDGMFALCKHFERLVDELNEVVNDGYQIIRGEKNGK